MRQDQVSSVAGIFLHFNLSPKGTPEGFVCLNGGETFQVNFPPELAAEISDRVEAGKLLSARVVSFRDAETDAHPVYELLTLDGGNRPLVIDGAGDDHVKVSGSVVRLNHAKRGEVNGAILDTGEFVHLRPHGAKAVGLKIGDRLQAEGEVRPGWAGTRVIEAFTCNGIDLEKKKKPHPHHPSREHPHPHPPRHDRATSKRR